MVFGLLTAIAACPAIIGTTEAIQQGQKANAREQHRGRKTNLTIKLPGAHSYKPKFEGCMVVLHDKKVCHIPHQTLEAEGIDIMYQIALC